MSAPLIIIPNYLGARPNCLEATDLYAVCCKNECEDLMGQLELHIAASEAAPHRIAEIVSNMKSDTITSPRKLHANLLARLNSIASHRDGKVKLHGRLFAQWMHHAFPNECPFPHEAGKSSPLTPDEWIGVDVSASEEEMQKLIDADSCSADGQQVAPEQLPWSNAEELLASAPQANRSPLPELQVNWYLALLLIAVSMYSMLSARWATHRQQLLGLAVKHGVSWQLMCVVWFSSVAVVTNILDRKLFAFVMCCGLAFNFFSRGTGCTHGFKCEKSLV